MGLFWKRKKGKNTEVYDGILPDKIEVTDVLDLHGFFPEEVPEIVDSFIEHALELKLREVKIIHGKGKSKLKWIVAKMLDSHSAVVDYYDAPPSRGGWGATIVELRPLKRKSVQFAGNRLFGSSENSDSVQENSVKPDNLEIEDSSKKRRN